MSHGTLIIGGLVKRPSTVVRGQSAMSKEYHKRHTRHIRGVSAVHEKEANNSAQIDQSKKRTAR